jgi:hypothetical protein
MLAMGGSRNIRGPAIAALSILAFVLAASSSAGAAVKPATMHLTAVVKKDNEGGAKGDKIVLSLLSGKKVVGSARFPGCQGAGTSVLCAGSVSIEGLGTDLETFVTFECSLVSPKCKAGTGLLEAKGGATKDTITLKIEPDQIEPGVTFPVIVAPAPK